MTLKQEKELLKTMLLEGITERKDKEEVEELGAKLEKLLQLGVENKKVSCIMLLIEYFNYENFNF